MLLPSPGLEDSAHGSNSHISTIAGHSTASPEEKYRYTPDSAYDSAEDRCSQRKTTQVPYFTPPPETKGTSKPRKRKRMADDEINGSHSSAKHRRKILQSQIVFVDPQDASYAWWWPGVIVPKHEIPIFRQTVEGEVTDPKEGECLVVYFEDASYNVVPESDCKPFSPYQAPYTEWINGENGKAFVADKAVIRAAACWESGVVPSGFSWLQEVSNGINHERNGSRDAGSSGYNRKRGMSSVANSRRNSQATLARKDSSANKESTSRKFDKAIPTPTRKPTSSTSSSMPIVQLTTTGSSVAHKLKSAHKAPAHSNPSRSASFKRSREDNTINSAGQSSAVSLGVCVKCGGQEAKQRRTSEVRYGMKNIGQRDGIIGTPLCKPCRELLDEILPASPSVMMEEESSWRPERRQLRVLRHLLPESKTDRLLRTLKGLQEMAQREQMTSSPNTVQPVSITPTTQSTQAVPFVPQFPFSIAPSSTTLYKQLSVSSMVAPPAPPPPPRATAEIPIALSPYASPPLSATAPQAQNQVDRNGTRSNEPAG